MNSIFSLILTKLQTKLAIDVPEIRYINMDLGQLDFYDQRPPVSFPALLADFETPYIPRQQQRQWGTITMKLRLAFAPYSSTDNLVPDAVKTKGLTYFEIENNLYRSIQDWNADGLLNVQAFERSSAVSEKRPDPFRVRQVNFIGQYEDNGELIPGDESGGSITSPRKELFDWWQTVPGQNYLAVGSVASQEKGYTLTADDDVVLITREGKVYDIVTTDPVDRQARFNTDLLRIEFDPTLPFNANETIFLQFKRIV